jgi:hypothetical protein
MLSTESKPSALKSSAEGRSESPLIKLVVDRDASNASSSSSSSKVSVDGESTTSTSSPTWIVDPEGLGAFSFETDQLFGQSPTILATVSSFDGALVTAPQFAQASLPIEMPKKKLVKKRESGFGSSASSAKSVLAMLGPSGSSHKLDSPGSPSPPTFVVRPPSPSPIVAAAPSLALLDEQVATIPAAAMAAAKPSVPQELLAADEDSTLDERDSEILALQPQEQEAGALAGLVGRPAASADALMLSPANTKPSSLREIGGVEEGTPPAPAREPSGGAAAAEPAPSEGEPLLPLLRQRLREAMGQ